MKCLLTPFFPEAKSDTFNRSGSNLRCLLTGILHDILHVSMPVSLSSPEYTVVTSDILLVIFAI